MKSELKTYTLRKLADAFRSPDLRVDAEFQRGEENWTLAQNQGLIDSLLRGYQIPLFYIHLKQRVNSLNGEVQMAASLVDGQQRLAAISSYWRNEFSLSDPQKAAPGTALPVRPLELPRWSGKKFNDLSPEDQERLLARELLVVEMSEDAQNEVRDLFIRLQAGTPLTAQQKRDAWPGDFTVFVIRHAGKERHLASNPHPFFRLVPRSQRLTVDDGDHYVDRLADTRKFFAGLAMTIMVRERSGEDFVDLKGKTINAFYSENFNLIKDDPAAARVIRTLDAVAKLPGFERLLAGKPMPFSMAFHLALLVDSLSSGKYVPVWRDDVASAVIKFQEDVAAARLHYKNTGESLPHHGRFATLLSGSGSDTAEKIRSRHSFFLSKVYSAIRIVSRDENRCFGGLEKEVIWNRDRAQCKNPDCNRRVPFREATIHHIIEHTAGGTTTLGNGILICPECHANRGEMQRLTAHFQEHIRKVSANPAQQAAGEVVPAIRSDEDKERVDAESGPDGNAAPTPGNSLKIVIHWRVLGVDREEQTIQEPKASDSIIKLLVEMIGAFRKSMEQQLTELPVIRFPLSRNPATAFINAAKGRPFPSIPVPGSDLYFCPQSDNPEKVRRLRTLFSRLSLPDGRDFPEGSVIFSVEPDPVLAALLA